MSKEKMYIHLEYSYICANCERPLGKSSNEKKALQQITDWGWIPTEEDVEKYAWSIPVGEFENGVRELVCSQECHNAVDYHFKWMKRTRQIALDKETNYWYYIKKREVEHLCLKEKCYYYKYSTIDSMDTEQEYCNHAEIYTDGLCRKSKYSIVIITKYCGFCGEHTQGNREYFKWLNKGRHFKRCKKCGFQLINLLDKPKRS